jgi:MoxR-like ATPase
MHDRTSETERTSTTPESLLSLPAGSPASLGQVQEVAGRLARAMNSVIEGKPDVVHTAITVLLAEGHLLLEDVPGVGKTMLAKTLARSIDCSVRRVQFTPDLLPSDITGVSVFNQDVRDFEFRPGAIFANVVVGDEINRASPKTQSALLESMEEGQVTVDGQTYDLPKPFIVMATQNPIEMEGTYPLPEAQRDRFMARISLGYPSSRAEVAMLDTHGQVSPLETLAPVTDAATVTAMVRAVRSVFTSDAIKQYVVDLSSATRASSALRLGASPRATLHMLRAARAHAALEGRDHVLPDDVQAIVVPVLAHRIIPTGETQLARRSTAEVLQDLMRRVPVPAAGR